MIRIKKEDLYNAYRKLKHYYFLDSSALDLRYKIAEWESNLDDNLAHLLDDIHSYINTGLFFKNKKRIKSYIFPKGFSENKPKNSLFTNTTKSAEIRSPFYFVDAPIEYHILAVLWCIKIGLDVENEHPNINVCFGNRLKLTEGRVSPTNKTLFEPFFINYNKWRNQAITLAIESLNKGKNVVLLNLDISSFYDNVRINANDICGSSINENHEFHYLTKLLMRFHAKYEKFRNANKNDNSNDASYRLPIGLLSSGILANWYLKEFDQKILDTRPIHYGRYVDDLLIVFEVPDVTVFQKDGVTIQQNLIKLLPDVFFIENSKLIIKSRNELTINLDKSTLFALDHKHPKTLLTLLKQDIEKNSSGFKFLPDEEAINSEFENSTGSLLYREADSGRIRDVHGLIPAKFKITQYLAKHIFFSHNLGHAPSPYTGGQMVSFFIGTRAVENYAQWERVLTYLFVNEFYDEFKQIVLNICKSIDETCSAIEKNKECINISDIECIQEALQMHLRHCLILCQSLDPRAWKNRISKEIKNPILDYTILRNSGMVRHKYMPNPILATTKYSLMDECSRSLIERDTLRTITADYLNYESKLKENYPTYIHLHDLALKQFWEKIQCCDDDLYELYSPQKFDSIVNEFEEWNRFEAKKFITQTKQPQTTASGPVDISKIILSEDSSIVTTNEQLCVALANIKIEENDLEDSLSFNKKSKLDRKPFDHLFNQITHYNSQKNQTRNIDLIVFPELSMPYEYLYGLCKHVKKSGVGVVTGLTYIVLPNRKVLNIEAVILPVVVNGFTEALPILRIKNYYAPHEKEMIESRSSASGKPLIVAEPENGHYYHLIQWRGFLFTVFNCFELTNIEHRSLFRGKIDCLIATEFNPDVSYFSNIVESASRDLHCFVIQSNNAKYGDSRICAPYRREQKDIIQIKGGKNPTILVEDISIAELRDFQSTGFAKQKINLKIKSTPAGFDRSISNSRFGKEN